MKLQKISPGSFASNCYILSDGGEATVIDPSAPAVSVMKALSEEGLTLKAILLTHGHFDHMLGLARLRDLNPDATVMIHADDAEMMIDGEKNASSALLGRAYAFRPPHRSLISGDEIKIGRQTIKVMHTPGHTRGSVCYTAGNLMFSGDTVMADGYGRCDLYGGNPDQMKYTLLRLLTLSDKKDYVIYPGHGNAAKLSEAIHNIYN
ncbi:MAG: MBL fold metallo-hydrolase [Ruminococcaceae bacterium]|nr:MBL fold metallo-hydrolase [Oscillospiraceae bacterium]